MAEFSRSLTDLAELAGGDLTPTATRVILRALSTLHDEVSSEVTKDDFYQLRAVVAELAEAQKRTEERVNELVEAQRKTEVTVGLLVEQVSALATESREVRRQLGGLSHSLGYSLENLAYRTLPAWLSTRHGLRVVEPLVRVFLAADRKRREVNVWGVVERADGSRLRVVGEAKAQLGEKHVSELTRLLEQTRSAWGYAEALGVLVTHMADPEALLAATARGFLVAQSFELEAG